MLHRSTNTIKITVISVLVTVLLIACSQTGNKSAAVQQQLAKGRLNYPFGTILKLDVEIVDGDDLQLKESSGKYLLNVLRIEDSVINDTLIIPFEDETGLFPKDDFELYEHLNDKTTGSLSPDEITKMEQHYAGKRFRIAAYESGKFTGLPDGYNEYLDERAGKSFHFQNYLIVIGKLY